MENLRLGTCRAGEEDFCMLRMSHFPQTIHPAPGVGFVGARMLLEP